MKKFLFLIAILAFSLEISAQYCNGGPFFFLHSNIENVNLPGETSNIFYNVPCPPVAVFTEDQTAMVADLIPGNTYTLSVTFGTCGNNDGGDGGAWIDWDNSDSFEPGESIGQSGGTVGTPPWDGPVDFTFTVPSDFSCATRMRVMQRGGGPVTLDPCETFPFGASIDFTIQANGIDVYTHYLDDDGDNYGSNIGNLGIPDGSQIITCDPTPPAGYANNNLDCDDNTPLLNVSPNDCSCTTGPVNFNSGSLEDSNVEKIGIYGDNATLINHLGVCPGLAQNTLNAATTELTIGGTYTTLITFSTCEDNFAGAGEAWIDWNDDLVFDPSESIGQSAGTPGTAPWDAPVPFTFTVPATAEVGQVFMRVMQLQGGTLPLDPCEFSSFSRGSTDDFFVTITPSCEPSDAVTLPTAGVNASAGGYCQEGTWTYYEDPAAAGTYLYAVEWDPTGMGLNGAAKAAATTTIQVDASPNSASNATNGIFFMGRQWGVDLGTVTLDGPVNIKYFYDPAEKAAAEAAATAHAAANGLSDDGFKWFKQTTNVDFSTITDPAFQADVDLTEAATGVENGVSFSQFDGIVSFSTGSGGASVGGTVLPVEFISFMGKVNEKINLLEWATASEINSSYYEIQRTIDGRNFVKIGKVEAAENSSENLHYKFEDENPLQAAYYRLKQVDLDGSYDFSNIIHINRPNEKGFTIGQVRPNPARTFATLEFNSDLAETIEFTLRNVDGKVVSNRSLEAMPGLNKVDLDLNSLATGVYFVIISNSISKELTRIVKTN